MGKAVIIVEEEANDASLVTTQRIPLSDGVIAEIRLGEVVFEDGSGGFVPDMIIAASQLPNEVNKAFTAALELLKDFKPKKITRLSLPAHGMPTAEDSYPEMKLPAWEYWLLAAFRIWAVINYFFPLKDLMGEDWDEVLREFIPRMEKADSALEYHLAVAEMITHIHYSHGFVDSPILDDHFGPAWPPIRLQLIENIPVITTILEEAAKTAGIRCGDIVLKIDGEDIVERLAHRAKYRAASTHQRLMYRTAFASLSGPEDSIANLTVCDRENHVKEVQLSRKVVYGALDSAMRSW